MLTVLPFGYGQISGRPRRPVPFQVLSPPSFVPSPYARFFVYAKQTQRSLQFWRRVLGIWASFKIVQGSITVQKKFRGAAWPRKTWDSHHEKAGQVR